MRQLAKESGYQRLLVVALHRSHCYRDLEQVKGEVSQHALTMLQAEVPCSMKVHYNIMYCRLCIHVYASTCIYGTHIMFLYAV